MSTNVIDKYYYNKGSKIFVCLAYEIKVRRLGTDGYRFNIKLSSVAYYTRIYLYVVLLEFSWRTIAGAVLYDY